jgi:transcription initiation factor TFIID subunit 3
MASAAPPPSLFHTLLRPSILQILRAQGFHGARPSVVDALTDLAARYIYTLCEKTAHHLMAGEDRGDGIGPTLVDVRMALDDVGAFLPEAVLEEQEWRGEEDGGGVGDFVKWFASHRSREIRRIALDGDDENTDYLTG